MPKALFVTYGGGHVAMVIPTILELQRRGGWEIVVLGLTTATAKLNEAGIPSLGFRDLLLPDDERAVEHGRRLAGENHNPGSGIPWEETVAYLGLSYSDLEDRVGMDEAARQYASVKRHAFLPLGPLKRLLQREMPDVVVVTSSPRAERAAALAAREAGIPSVVMMDLFGREWDYFYDPDYGDHVLVFAPIVYEDYLRRGRTPNNLSLTGNPAFDRLAAPKFVEAGRRWRAEHKLTDHRVILWAATTLLSREHRMQVLDSMSDCVRRHPDWRFLFRPHPNAAAEHATMPEGCLLADNRLDLAIHLHASDCVVVTVSTCGVEAALLDKPVVKMRFIDPSYRIYSPTYARMDGMAPYEEMGIAAPVTRLEELDSAIMSVMPAGERFSMLQAARRELPPIGQASRRAADVVTEVCKQGVALPSRSRRCA